MRTLSDIQKKLLATEFPGMSFEGDPDIERYFELRSRGMQADALALYNTRLRRKYPDDIKRAELLRCFRSRDPRYRELLAESMAVLAERALSRTTGIISLLTKDIDSVDMTDAYSVIKLAEDLLAFISPDRYVAISFTERYARYATILAFRQAQMERTAELIRLYVTDTLESVEDFKKDRAEKERQSKKKELLKHGSTSPHFDLSRVTFSPDDLAHILIPSSITKTEDKVIAFCVKYWNRYSDVAFEKTIFLYSKKYGTKHSDVFLAIKNGRSHGWKDEEILNAVLSNVVTGYYYSITGDLYLQRGWALYKQSAEIAVAKVPEPVTLPVPRIAKKKNKKTHRQHHATLKPRVITKRSTGRFLPFKPTVSALPSTEKISSTQAFIPNSIADIIRKNTGKTYTVYKELFFRKIRPAIREVLASSTSRKGDVFGNRQNDAEEIIYQYLFAHYADPYQNWKDSIERKQIEAQGYAVPEIEPIIEKWIRTTSGLENSARA
jgi:hypothetical protein